MSRKTFLLPILAFTLLVFGSVLAGCSSPELSQETGSLQLTSVPPGAEIYLDNVYHGTTPAAITIIHAGTHTIEMRMSGYEPWSTPVTISKGSN